MSAALPIPLIWAGQTVPQPLATAVHHIRGQRPQPRIEAASPDREKDPEKPVITWAFYRRHTENLLRRYLYASLQVGRSPNLLGESVGRGWVSSRRVRTFEDALIFVLDVERCLKRLSPLELEIIHRVILQEYTQAETAALLRISLRTACARLSQALDRLTESLVEANLLILPD